MVTVHLLLLIVLSHHGSPPRRGAHVTRLTVYNTCVVQQETCWNHIKVQLLDNPDDQNPLAVAYYVAAGITTFGDLMALSLAQLDALTYSPAGQNNAVLFPVRTHGCIKNVISALCCIWAI